MAHNRPRSAQILVELDSIGDARDRVQCKFGEHELELLIDDLNGVNYKLVRANARESAAHVASDSHSAIHTGHSQFEKPY